jgi:hypothetical protein
VLAPQTLAEDTGGSTDALISVECRWQRMRPLPQLSAQFLIVCGKIRDTLHLADGIACIRNKQKFLAARMSFTGCIARMSSELHVQQLVLPCGA